MTNGNGDVVSYTYDQYGNKLSMTYPDGRVVSYTYDNMNRMTSVTGLDGEVTTYAYDAAGRRVETAFRNLTTEYKYDVVGSLVEKTTTGSSNLSFQYSYNLNGYITGEVRTENGETITSAYAYDPLGELVSFTQSTGYGEQYTYDKVGNMTQKVITPLGSVPNEKGTVENAVTLKMKYNQGNQLVSMANGSSKITYKYDKNGSMVEKALTSKQYGTLTDTYAYNSLDQLVSYTGYDGYQQQFAYDANGMRLSKSEYGNSNRSTLEELLRGEIAGLPEVVVPNVAATNSEEAAIPPEYEWATTEYLYDITQEYYQVIQQTTTSGNTTATTAYAYGLERIAAYDANNTTQYIYDGRGSVAQTISAPVAGASVSAALPEVEVHSYSYTAFGEQMGVKVSGFGYNAEDFDAATGMINLRMRLYEPILNRFSQKDVIRGQANSSLTQNRYIYCCNIPVSLVDADGMKATTIWNTLKSTASRFSNNISNSVHKNIAPVLSKTLVDTSNNLVEKCYNCLEVAQEKIKDLEGKRQVSLAEKRAILASVCNGVFGTLESKSSALIYSGNIHGSTVGLPADMKTNDQTQEQFPDQIQSWYIGQNKEAYMSDFKGLTDIFAVGKLKPVVNEMIDHFLDGTGTPFRNDALTEVVSQRSETQRFITDTLDIVHTALDENSGDLAALRYDPFCRTDSVMVDIMSSKNINLSRYSYGKGFPELLFSENTYNGLTLAIHSWTSVDISINNYQLIDNQYSGEITYTFSDNFGLDSQDLDPYGALAGFRAWYILQHSKEYNGAYKPFETKVDITLEFSGTID